MKPKILFLKHTGIQINSWFVELGVELSKIYGPSLMYTDIESDLEVGNLKILAAPPYSRKSYLSRLLSWFRYFIGSIIVTWRTSAVTPLFIVAQPPYLPIIGFIRNLIYGQRYMVWIDDVYPDVVVRKGLLKDKNPIIMLWKILNKLMYRRAQFVTTLGPCMRELVFQYVDSKEGGGDVIIIPTWVDPTVIKPFKKNKNPFALKYGQVDKLTVLYSGNFGVSHDIESIFAVAEQLQKYKDIHFMMIGDGAKFHLVKEASRRFNNITSVPFQPEEMLPYSLSCADIAIVTLDSGYEGISMPSKTYYMMAAGAALLGISETPSDLQFVIERYKCGINVQPGDVSSFVDFVLELRENQSLITSYRNNSRQAAELVFSKKINTEKISKMIRKMLPG